ncbi:hypothetical protein PIROE2DRAFT_11924 [Piromyces sp. E2]|nr:hypothetical protein PIROE2DRAFT_11924 [Piromyces sp. E2]|eukprot:OUM61952.1 hypothetical protein PIROE2DRAFT_11924 [Piromyces sp. E2]
MNNISFHLNLNDDDSDDDTYGFLNYNNKTTKRNSYVDSDIDEDTYFNKNDTDDSESSEVNNIFNQIKEINMGEDNDIGESSNLSDNDIGESNNLSDNDFLSDINDNKYISMMESIQIESQKNSEKTINLCKRNKELNNILNKAKKENKDLKNTIKEQRKIINDLKDTVDTNENIINQLQKENKNKDKENRNKDMEIQELQLHLKKFVDIINSISFYDTE